MSLPLRRITERVPKVDARRQIAYLPSVNGGDAASSCPDGAPLVAWENSMKTWSDFFITRTASLLGTRSHRSGRGGRRRRIFTVVSLTSALITVGALVSAPADASIQLANGSFETPVVTAGSYHRFSAGESIGAWTVTTGTVDLSGAGLWETVDGVQSLELNGNTPGAISQRISTLPLTKYKVSYWLAGEPIGGPSVKTGQVLINGQVAQNFSFDITGKSRPHMGYVPMEFTFLSLGTSATLQFATTTTYAYGPVIDHVKVDSCLLALCLS
jgi:choice-of-anchor C domain-containing protein